MGDYTTRVGCAKDHIPPSCYNDLFALDYEYKPDDGKSVECGTEPWPDHVKCPDCEQAEVVWAEAGYVPGHRICPGCGSHWELASPTESERKDKQWILRRARFY
jgi:ribosomal protein S27E